MLYSMDDCQETTSPDENMDNWSVIRKSFENLIFGTVEEQVVEFKKIVVYCGILWYIDF